MKRTRFFRCASRLLPLVLWMGWVGAVDRSEPPASGPASGAGQPAVDPLLDVALPNVPSLRAEALESAKGAPAGAGGKAAAAVGSSGALHVPGATLDPNLRGALHPYLSLLEQVSNRTRGPPTPVG